MTRTIDAATDTAAKAEHIIYATLAKLDFSSGFLYINDTDRDIVYDGNTYLGAGNLAQASAVEEGPETKPYAVNLTLSGIPSAYIAIALGEDYQGRDAEIYLALLDDEYAIVGQPVKAFQGRIDTMDMEVGETAAISLTVQSKLVDWDRPRVERYNHETQIVKYPGDLGLEFVDQMVERTIKWGQA